MAFIYIYMFKFPHNIYYRLLQGAPCGLKLLFLVVDLFYAKLVKAILQGPAKLQSSIAFIHICIYIYMILLVVHLLLLFVLIQISWAPKARLCIMKFVCSTIRFRLGS